MNIKDRYDIAIIGGGISGLMAAYRLTEYAPGLAVCIIDKGGSLEERRCPVVDRKKRKCAGCPSCAIVEGLAGAGAFSDGKYVISTEYGGWLTDFIPKETVMDYIEQADGILMKFGATDRRYQPDDELKRLCLTHDLHMAQAQLKHLGTDSNFSTMKNLITHVAQRCDIFTDMRTEDVDKDRHIIYAVEQGRTLTFEADTVIFAVGRSGSGFFAQWCEKNRIPLENNQVDIGVRVELPALIWDHFSKKIYEPKISFRSSGYGDTTRMFCFNERGNVVTENTGGVLTVNGHAYHDQTRKTENSNFALLSTIRFTQPFKNPIEYARHVAKLANLISGGSVLVQRLGDLKNGRRTDEKRLKESSTTPTLEAVPGDLSLCLPKRQLDNIIETLHALDKVAPGTANFDTMLYGIECKYYSARPKCNDFMLEGCDRIYAAGDGAGFTRSLSHAAANGLHIAHLILGVSAIDKNAGTSSV